MFQAGMIIIGVAIVLSATIPFGLRFKAERLRLKILKAQHDARQACTTHGSVPGKSLALDSSDEPSWENLRHIVDLQEELVVLPRDCLAQHTLLQEKTPCLPTSL